MKLTTRILSAFVACLMVVSLLPATAFAADVAVTAHDPDTGPHDFSVVVSVLDPGDCRVEGSKGIAKYQCSGCTKTTYKAIDAAHQKAADAQPTGGEAPTCGKAGYNTYTCKTCRQPFNETVPPTEQHEPEEGVIQATCTTNAKVGTKCKNCGIQIGKAEEVPGTALDHEYKMTVITAATCTEDGTQQRKCIRCDATDGNIETITKTGHKWNDDANGYIPATCEHPAQQKQTCGVCGATQKIDIADAQGNPLQPALPHDTVETKTPATCTEPAYIVTSCNNCDYKDKQIDSTVNGGAAMGHDWDDGVTVAPNCMEGGYKLYTCKRTNCSGYDANGANNGDATGKNDSGKATKTDTPTGAVADAHVIDMEKSTELSAPDCSKNQNGIYKAVCAKCGASMGYKSVPYEHNYEGAEETTVTEATCTTGGTATVQCQNPACTHTKTITTDPTGHTWSKIEDEEGVLQDPGQDGWVVTKAPTCGKAGEKARDCEKCNVDDKTETVNPTGQHKFAVPDNPIIDATCTENGKAAALLCSVCNAEDPDNPAEDLGDLRPATGHDWTEWKEATPASCTEKGVAKLICKTCKTEAFITNGSDDFGAPAGTDLTREIPQLDHDMDVTQTKYNGTYYETIDGDCESSMGLRFMCTICKEEVEVYVTDTVPGSHKWTEDGSGDGWTVTKTATCTETGLKERKCLVCEKKESETIATVAHSIETKTVLPTCEKGGYDVPWCSVCKTEQGAHTNPTEPNASNHVYGEGHTYLQEPNCTTAGIEVKVCQNCSKRNYANVPAGHNWDEGTVTTQPGCETAGEKTFTCQAANCPGYTEGGQNGDATGKNAAGKAIKTEPIGAVGHDWKGRQTDVDEDGYKQTKAPTCGVAGEKTRTCQRANCDGGENGAPKTETGTINATGDHNYEPPKELMTPATCTENAKAAGWSCRDCGAADPDPEHADTDLGNVDDSYKAKGHDWTEWKEATPASCTVKGVEKLYCATCHVPAYITEEADDFGAQAGTALTRDIPEVDHVMDTSVTEFGGNYFEVIPDTCEHDMGIKFKCVNCREYITEYTGTKSGTHQWTEDGSGDGWATTKPATCVETGVKTRTCVKCSATETDSIALVGHTITSKVVDPTCMAGGYTVDWCSVCKTEQGAHTNETQANPTNHVYDDDTHDYIDAPTCTTAGIERMTCTLCGKSSYTKATAGHNWDAGQVTTQPGCEAPGVKTFTCQNDNCPGYVEGGSNNGDATGTNEDGKATKTESVGATGHNYSTTRNEELSEDPTCGKAGKNVFVCSNNCGINKEEPVSATNVHSYKDKVIPATCQSPRQAGEVCETCGTPKGEMQSVGDPLTHSFGAWETVTEASCGSLTNGQEKRTCQNEGCKEADTGEAKVETREIVAKHTLGESKFTSATCTEGAHVKTMCTVCGGVAEDEDLSELSPALGHDRQTRGEPSTCKDKGWTETYCARCKVVLVERTELPLSESHDYENKVIQESTCKVKGIARPTCRDCGATAAFVALELAEHEWAPDENGTTHTCPKCNTTDEHDWTDNGEGQHECETCGASGNHDWVDDDNDDTHSCSVCEAEEEHKLGNEYNEGLKVYADCSVCGAKVLLADLGDGEDDDPQPQPCQHEWNASTGKCNKCQAVCEHSWNEESGTCGTCGMTKPAVEPEPCSHEWNASTGKCDKCQAVCEHSWNEDTGTCGTCGMTKPVVEPEPEPETCEHETWEYFDEQQHQCANETCDEKEDHHYGDWNDSENTYDSNGELLKQAECSGCHHVKYNGTPAEEK